MKYASLFLLVLITAGCAGTGSRPVLTSADNVPRKEYTGYFYSSGAANYFRAVLLKDPDSGMQVEPYSEDISETAATFDQALAFMGGFHYTGKVVVRRVEFRGSLLGYLLTRPATYGPFSRGSIEVDLFERNGKIVFAVDENLIYGD